MTAAEAGATRDWFGWHMAYDDPASALSARLRAVQGEIGRALDTAPAGPLRVISMCAGQGRDLLGVLPDHPRRPDVTARLVELDPRNAAVAARAARAAGLDGVDVVVGDASATDAYQGMTPAHLVLACGVFGHASDDDIRAMTGLLPGLCAAGATVVWTRGRRHDEAGLPIGEWFVEAGFEEVGSAAGDGGWRVGAHRLVAPPAPFRPGLRLFTFLDRRP